MAPGPWWEASEERKYPRTSFARGTVETRKFMPVFDQLGRPCQYASAQLVPSMGDFQLSLTTLSSSQTSRGSVLTLSHLIFQEELGLGTLIGVAGSVLKRY